MTNLALTSAGGSDQLPLTGAASFELFQLGGKIRFSKLTSAQGDGDCRLGIITNGLGGVKLEAFKTLHVQSANSQATLGSIASFGPSNEHYKLEPTIDGRCEILLLRPGDEITSPGITSSVSCVWWAPEVQVSSSAADITHPEHSGTENGVEETPEDETEDEAIPDDTVTEVPVTQPVTQPTKSQLSATPHLPRDPSTVVHETPTTTRTLDRSAFNIAPSTEGHDAEAIPPSQAAIAITETFSTARTGNSPNTAVRDTVNIEPDTGKARPQGSVQVRISARQSRKRQSPEHSPIADAALAADEPPVKRTRTAAIAKAMGDDTVQASSLDDNDADPKRITYSMKAKRRKAVASEATPTKSPRCSQRSASATTVAAYEGDAPRVVTSNSAIKEESSTVKFLRKHGGALVKSVEDRCNVLCVRDGGLSKTVKVIQAIALGVPIVTDKWLTESAKAEGFLDLASFKPSVAQQEKDWKFDLEKVWGVPQTPFKGYAIYFTPALKKTYVNFREMERACQTVGAKVVPKLTSKVDKVIVLATGESDPDAEKMIEDGEPCYHKDLLTTSILRGNLDLDSGEFRIKAKNSGPRRKAQRNSV